MTCVEFNSVVVVMARGAAVSRDVSEHVAACEACAAELTEQRELMQGLKRLAVDLREERPPAVVRQNLLLAFRGNSRAAGTAAGGAEAIDQTRGYWLRAAAAVLVVVGTGAWLLLSNVGDSSSAFATRTNTEVPARPVAARGAGEFVPVLGYGPVDATDSGVVVRVLLPEDAFQYFAVPVSRMPGGQRFPADVLIADDGSVRAIRLVSNADGR